MLARVRNLPLPSRETAGALEVLRSRGAWGCTAFTRLLEGAPCLYRLSSAFLRVLSGECGCPPRENLAALPHHIRAVLRRALEQLDQRVGALAQ
jgi:hypothetical protein